MTLVFWALRRSLGGVLALPLVAGCAAPRAAEHSIEDAGARIDARPEDVAAAFERAALGLRVPVDPSAIGDPARADHWRAAAVAFAPASREARSYWKTVWAAGRGAPGDVEMELVAGDLGDVDAELGVLFDIVGLLHVGPARAAREVASAEEALALASWAKTALDVCLAVDAARVELAVARERRGALDALADWAEPLRVRADVLAARGWVAPAATASLDGALAHLEGARDEARQMETRAAHDLALASGLPSDSAAFGSVGASVLEEPLLFGPRREAEHPVLVLARLRLELAEAELRAAAAKAWPGVQLGPQLAVGGDGGVSGWLNLNLPWPSRWRGPLRAAEERRDGALFAYEETLHGLREARLASVPALEAAQSQSEWGEREEQAAERRLLAVGTLAQNQRVELAECADAIEQRVRTAGLGARELGALRGAELALWAAGEASR
ncbi:MAG: hypothetical protein GC161_01985 [Planctomycetaceae bacterium]|nr:hypothetical protein [Planctomycetaceae bacterium]